MGRSKISYRSVFDRRRKIIVAEITNAITIRISLSRVVNVGAIIIDAWHPISIRIWMPVAPHSSAASGNAGVTDNDSRAILGAALFRASTSKRCDPCSQHQYTYQATHEARSIPYSLQGSASHLPRKLSTLETTDHMHKFKFMISHTLSVVAAAALLSSCGAASSQGYSSSHSEAQLPVTRVVLYQNGIGYFERKGKLKGNMLTLQIRPSQINDLLKSLTVIDRSKGRAMSVSLPLEKTSAQILSELPAQVRDAGGLLDVLRVFRGARVKVDGTEGSASGRVVGVEPMQKSVDDNVLNDWRLTLKAKDGSLKVYPVSAIKNISMRDRTLAKGLDQSLDVSLNDGNWKPISLAVRMSGNSSHDLRVSYIVEMPLWKPAYRIVVGDDGKPLLQGWAVVDNVSGEDWNNVQLSLVAGTPMSFVYDLHSPQFMKRVDLTPSSRRTAMAPVVEKSGVMLPSGGDSKDELQRSYANKRRSRSAAGAMPSPKSAPAPSRSYESMAEPIMEEDMDDEDNFDMMSELEEQTNSSAGGENVGALFRYDLEEPVTVPDRSSTLVSIINERVAGKEVVYFRPELMRGASQVNPYRAVMFENNTSFSLEKGPVSIFAGGTFVGEGFLNRMEQGATTFLTYSIDGKVVMAPSSQNTQEGMRLLKIIDGMIVSEVLEVSSSIYKVDNRHKEEVTAFIKTPKRMGWKLRNKPEGTVELPDSFVVPVSVAKGSSQELKVDWIKPVVRRVAIDTSLSTNVLKLYLASGKAPANVRKSIDEILKLKQRISDIDEDYRRFQQQHREASRDQDRVRANVNLLRKTPGNASLRNELTKKLAKLEADLGTLSGKIVKLSEEKAQLTRQINVLIRNVTVIEK